MPSGALAGRSRAAARAVAATLVAVVLAEAFGLSLPAEAQQFHRAGFLLVVATVVVVALRGGLVAAVAAAAVGAVGIAHIFLAFGQPLGPPSVRLQVAAVIGAFTLALAALIGHLRDRERVAVDALIRERESHGQAEGRRFGIGRLFDSVDEAVVVADARGRIALWNPAAERIFGWSRDEAIGTDVAVLVPPRLRDRHREGMRRFAETGTGAYVGTRTVLELPALRRDGSEIVVEMTLSALPAEPGGEQAPFALSIIRDVTERVRLQREVERSNRALRDANGALESFAFMVSHDLKEPVRAIEAFSSAAADDLAEGHVDDARDLIARTREASQRLTRLLTSVLEVARASRHDAADLRAVTVREALESEACAARYRDLVRERGARVVFAEEQGTPPVLATEAALSQALGNLVVNALKHNPRVAPLVVVRAAPMGDALVEVVVEDDGQGFPPESVARFEDARTLRGGGFGLVIVRRTVEHFGGKMWLGRSKELGGAAVHLTLPAADVGPVDEAREPREAVARTVDDPAADG